MTSFLQARLADPLWALAVQWRIGEFIGKDAAFPITTAYQVNVHPLISDIQAPDAQLPMDALLSTDSPQPPEIATPVEAGADLLQQLIDHQVSETTITSFVAAHPFTATVSDIVDPQGESYLALLSGRIPDASLWEPLLRSATGPGGTLPPEAGVPDTEVAAVLSAAQAWLAEVDAATRLGSDLSTEPSRWRPDTLHYQMTVPVLSAAGSFAAAQATSWDGDELDWYNFNLTTALGTTSITYPALQGVDPETGTVSGVGPAHPLSYPGAPNPRYWAMEDGNVNFPDVQTGKGDLARMLLIQFATVAAPDWYLQPVPVPTGSVLTTTMTVQNTFGESSALPMLASCLAEPGQVPSSSPDWVMFRPCVTTDASRSVPLDGLLLPALTTDNLRSEVESVALVRDDVFDRGWALETTVLSRDNRPFERPSSNTATAIQPGRTPLDDGTTVHYLTVSEVPQWAFVLQSANSPKPALELKLPDPLNPPLGLLLADIKGSALQEEMVTPLQAKISRQHRMARGPDGEVLVWACRQYRVGGNAPSISLDFDRLTS